MQSCDYRFYPQQIDVYGFDSSRQTKFVIQPYFNVSNLHLGFAHSFTNHLFVSSSLQGDFDFIHAIYGDSWGSKAFSINLSTGYFKENLKGTGFEIVPGLTYERTSYHIRHQASDWTYTGNHWWESGEPDYLIPSIQPSIYFKNRKINFSLTGKVSYLFQTEKVYYLTSTGYQSYKEVFYPRSFLFQPSIELYDPRSKWLRIYLTLNISSKKGDDYYFTPPCQFGMKFMMHRNKK